MRAFAAELFPTLQARTSTTLPRCAEVGEPGASRGLVAVGSPAPRSASPSMQRRGSVLGYYNSSLLVASELYMLRRLGKARRTTKAGSAIDEAVARHAKKPVPVGRH